jgi:hypothetical protein
MLQQVLTCDLGSKPWERFQLNEEFETLELRAPRDPTTTHDIPLKRQTHGQLKYGKYKQISICVEIYDSQVFRDSTLRDFYPLQHANTPNLQTLNLQIGQLELTSNQWLIFTSRFDLQIL